MIEVQERLDLLVEFDVAAMLTQVVRQISEKIDAGDELGARTHLIGWERLLGSQWADIAERIRAVRRHYGYGVAASTFARSQRFRRAGAQWLLRGVESGDDRLMARWRWILAGYVNSVAAFVESEEQRLAVASLAEEVRGAMRKRPLNKYPVLRANIDAREASLQRREPLVSRRRHSQHRVMQVLDLVDASAHRAETLAAERERLRARLVSARIDPARLGAVDGLPSLAAQVRRYRVLVAEVEGLAKIASAATAAAKLESDLARLKEKLRVSAQANTRASR